MSELPPEPIETANEIDYMYLSYAIKNNGTIVDKETADAVNESIDRITDDIDTFGDWIECPEMLKFIEQLED